MKTTVDLRTVIQSPGKPGRFRLRDGSYGRTGSRRPQNWRAIRETIYQGRGE